MWAELPDDIRAELNDERFTNRKHNSRATYASGCRGPLCRKSERDRERLRNIEKGYTPTPEARMEEPENIDAIIEWHVTTLQQEREKALEERREQRRRAYQSKAASAAQAS